MGMSSGKDARESSPRRPHRDPYQFVAPAAAAAPPAAQRVVGAMTPRVEPRAGSGPSINVALKQLSGRSHTISGIAADANVAELKRMAENTTGIPAASQKLVFAGRLLNDTDTLHTFGVVDGVTVMLAMRMGQGSSRAAGSPASSLQEMLDTYEISIAAQSDLEVLTEFDIVFLADDSGSMNMTETTAGVTQSRWKELQGTLSALIDFASYFDDDGTDIYFLNRPGLESVTDGKDPRIRQAFEAKPRGSTPLAARFRWVVESRETIKPLLVIIATDGEPDEGTACFVSTARKVMTMPGRNVRLGIMACTQDDRAVAWLNELDDDPVVGDKVDVCDDYESERTEVLRSGKVTQFKLSDYYVKAMLGPVLAKYDNMD